MSSASEKTQFRAAIVGGTGYGGAELIRQLLQHPMVKLTRVTSIDHVGEAVEAVHRNLGPTSLRFENISLQEAGEGNDVIFLALPHKVSATMAPELAKLEAAVVDLSGDFRLRKQADYEQFYSTDHPHPEFLGQFVYGLPELHRQQIRKAKRVASPGCFATTIALGLLPLAHAGLLRGTIHTVACTGSSGSGAYASTTTHHPLRAANLKTYKSLSHQHTPEIVQTLTDACQLAQHRPEFSLAFVPVSAPLVRGILANSFVQVPAGIDGQKIHELMHEFYRTSPFVRVLGGGAMQAEVVAVKGSMWVDLSWTLATDTDPLSGMRSLVVTTALDNLIKGGAGQAIQSMNLMLGLPEDTGLTAPGLWP